ncbi:hypothetical protein HELRODRAFT_193727 [Helobdella robusta]|uniref:WSC domain-containing protein n=1 Tax=Helobdella robusta TaxID=6412 RepID=T1FVA7_HELRO|nr:hypothetical protein HELRODRAFT_193727 [Helobdella robusta]ESN95050.1 hypothetical protein HELRODRAFT_193727 [Helobdella robusta]
MFPFRSIKYFTIFEVVLLTFYSVTGSTAMYIGCYSFILEVNIKMIHSFENCKAFCMKNSNVPYIALHKGRECYCVARASYPVTSKLCDSRCASSLNNLRDGCGGKFFYSLYSIRATVDYQHSLIDHSAKLTPNSIEIDGSGYLTVEICISMCIELNKTLATVGRTKCHCGSIEDQIDLTSPLLFKIKCHATCPGDTSQICDCNTKYSTEFQVEVQTGSSYISHCWNGPVHRPSVSCAGGCQPGWKGSSCDLRDCSQNNGQCGSHLKCEVVTVNDRTYSECVCTSDKYRTKLWTCDTLAAKRNLALRKGVTSSRVLSPKEGKGNFRREDMVDGQVLGSKMIHLDSRGDSIEWIAVDLAFVYEIDYVVAFNRQCVPTIDDCATRIEGLKVGLNDTLELANEKLLGNYSLCGVLPPMKRYLAGVPLKISCTSPVFGRFVIIQPRAGVRGFTLVELEVYEKAKRQPVDKIGCFEVFESSLNVSVSSVQSCQDECENYGLDNLIFAMKRGICYCGSKADMMIEVVSIECDKHFVVYSGRKVFVEALMGCFVSGMLDDKTPTKMILSNDSAYTSCSLFCKRLNAVEFAISIMFCLCGDLYDKYAMVRPQECNVKCLDRKKKLCGADKRYSLYRIFDRYDFLERPRHNFCFNSDVSLGSNCSTVPGACFPGWKGVLCDIRDCKVDNGKCGNNAFCLESFVDGKKESKCHYPDGFKLTASGNLLGIYLNKASGVMYLGCYWAVVAERSTAVESYADCKIFCSQTPQIIMIGLHRGEECHCLSSARYPVSSLHCNLRCSDGISSCGGSQFFSVFQIKHQLDFSNLLLTISAYDLRSRCIILKHKSMTSDKCVKVCLELKKSIALLKASNLCVCTTPHLTDPLNCLSDVDFVSNCTHACPGDEHQKCWSENCQMKLSTRTNFEMQTSFSALMHCSDGVKFSTSDCKKGCKPGWRGELCNERDCLKNFGDCGALICQMTRAGGKEYSECVCKKFYYRTKNFVCKPLPKTYNLALRRKVTMSSFGLLNSENSSLIKSEFQATQHWKYAVDGSLVELEVVRLFSLNSSHAGWLAVDLLEEYAIARVVVYPRKCDHRCKSSLPQLLLLRFSVQKIFSLFLKNEMNIRIILLIRLIDNLDLELDHHLLITPGSFVVVLNSRLDDSVRSPRSNSVLCGEHSADSKGVCQPLEPITIVCNDASYTARFVIIEKIANVAAAAKGEDVLAVTEVEVHGAVQKPNHPVYIGCFEKFTSFNVSEASRTEDCHKFCKSLDRENTIFAIKKGTTCHCGTDADVKVDLMHCDEHFQTFSTYLNKASFLGCFHGHQLEALGTLMYEGDVKSPFKSCQFYCRSYHFKEFALKRSVCLCGDRMFDASKQIPTSSCAIMCKDDSSKTCGSSTTFSLYKSRSRFSHRTDPTHHHFCMNEGDLSKDCQPGNCTAGWTGELCDVRDCSVKNGDCVENSSCVVNTRAGREISECRYPVRHGLNKLGKIQKMEESAGNASKYIGCYASVVHSSVTAVYRIEGCRIFCEDDDDSYLIGLNNGRMCFCVERAAYAVSSKLCDMPCGQKDEICGAAKYYSIYQKVLQAMKKCSIVNWPQTFIHFNKHFAVKPAEVTTFALLDAGSLVPESAKVFQQLHSLTIEMCMAICAENNFPLAYLTAGDECRCATRDAEKCGHPKSYQQSCNSPCRGNADQKCGGENCAAKFLACQVQNGGCGGRLTCNVATIKGDEYSECVCPDGQYRTATWDCQNLPPKNLAFRKRIHSSPEFEVGQSMYLVDGHIIKNSLFPDLQSLEEIIITLYLENVSSTSYKVDLDNVLDSSSPGMLCNTYSLKATTCAGSAIRVNCLHPELRAKYIFIRPTGESKHYVAIDEIEAYGGDEVRPFHYVGCFGSFKIAETLDSRLLSFNKCHRFCEHFQRPLLMMALKNGEKCHCGTSPDDQAESSYCAVKCPGDEHVCGGRLHFAVFSPELPEESFVGCYKETIRTAELQTVFVVQEFAFASCSVHCRTQNSIEFAIMKSTQCLCGDLMNATEQVPTAECNENCVDDATSSCGGSQRFALYKTFSRYEAKRERNFCLDRVAKRPECGGGMCVPGWSGPLCNVRDCSVKNGACEGNSSCVEVIVGAEVVTESKFVKREKAAVSASRHGQFPLPISLLVGLGFFVLSLTIVLALLYFKKFPLRVDLDETQAAGEAGGRSPEEEGEKI